MSPLRTKSLLKRSKTIDLILILFTVLVNFNFFHFKFSSLESEKGIQPRLIQTSPSFLEIRRINSGSVDYLRELGLSKSL